MSGCFSWLILAVGGVLAMVSLLQWFEQATEAVDNRWWNKVLVLVIAPPAVWFFPSKVAAGRPTPFPKHVPVRGFGTAPIAPKTPAAIVAPPDTADEETRPIAPPIVSDGPPPGTPKEFIGMPVIPPKKKSARPAVDPEKLAKLKEKMRQQGMLGDGE